jgi:hypothetical protein
MISVPQMFGPMPGAARMGHIRVPLSRDLRATHYRAQGCSFAVIARRLGLTESGVRGLFKRLETQQATQSKRKINADD